MSNNAQLQKLRLLLEGQEVPVISAFVTGTKNGPANANISIPYVKEATDLHPRTLVHLFVFKEIVSDSRTDLRNWILLFGGEILGVSVIKSDSARVIQLSCTDWSSYWDSAKLYWGSNSLSFNTAKAKQMIAAGASVASRSGNNVDTVDEFINLLKASPTTIPTLTGLLGGVVNLIESIGGIYDAKAIRKFRGISDFISIAELRLHLSRMVGVPIKDSTSSKFLESVNFSRYLRVVSRNLQQTASYRQLVEILLGKVYHQYSSIPAPPYIKAGDTAITKVLVPVGKSIKDPGLASLMDQAEKDVRKMYDAAVSEHEETIQAPSEHGGAYRPALDPVAYAPKLAGPLGQEVSSQELEPNINIHNKFTTNTAGVLLPADYTALQAGAEHIIKSTSLGPSDSINGQDGATILSALQHVKDASTITAFMNTDIQYEFSPIKGKGFNNEKNLRRLLDSCEKALEKIDDLKRKSYKQEKREVVINDRLVTHILCPDIYMVPPPSCNVIFPDQYATFSVNRNWMNEVTRMLFYGQTSTGATKLNKLYFSPNINILSGPKAKDTVSAAQEGAEFMMKHERFTGVIAGMESLGDNEIFNKIDKEVNKENETEWGKVSPHLYRAANYLFFKHRFEDRTMSLRCKFLPNIVVGLPALVLSHQLGQESLIKLGKETTAHYLGLVEQVSHAIDSGGSMSTSIVLSHVREYREGLDIFDNQEDGQTTQTRTKAGTPRKKVEGDFYAPVIGWTHDEKYTKDGTVLAKSITTQTVGGYSSEEAQTVPIVINKTEDEVKTIKKKKVEVSESGKASVVITEEPVMTPEPTTSTTIPVVGTQNTAKTTGYFAKGIIQQQIREGQLKDAFKKTPSLTKVPNLAPGENGNLSSEQSYLEAALTTEIDDADKVLLEVKKDGTGKPITLKDDNGNTIAKVDVYISAGTKAKKKDVKFSFEDVARPPWLDHIYLNKNIGTEFYHPMIGCLSVIDNNYDSVSLSDVNIANSHKVLIDSETKNINIVQLLPNEAGELEEVEIEIKNSFISNITIFKVVEDIANVFRVIKSASNDTINDFINTYTARKYANIYDLFADGKGGIVASLNDPYVIQFDDVEYSKLKGFHSKAFGNKDDLSDFSESLGEELGLAMLKSKVRKINANLDTRKDKLDRVLKLKDVLESIHAFKE